MTTSPSVGVYSEPLMESSGSDSVRQELGPFIAPSLEELLPQLSLEERVRLQSHLREHERKVKRWSKCPTLPSGAPSERKRNTTIMPHVRHALHYYNARHPGDEFDAVKPMESRASFRKRMWAHVNFWARSRKSNKIKRFFAEVHYNPEPIVEVCTIIEEPLDWYRKSCAFCPGNRDILHLLVPVSLFVEMTRTGCYNNSSLVHSLNSVECHSLAARVRPPPPFKRKDQRENSELGPWHAHCGRL